MRGIQTAEEWHVLEARLFYPRLAGGSNPHPRHRERHRAEQGLCCARGRGGTADKGDGTANRDDLSGSRTIQSRCDFYLFATSIAFGSPEEFVKRVPKEYRRRWKIETGYRVKEEFKIRTCSRSYVTRVLFFVVQCIIHNFLNVLKRILHITAHQLKSRIAEDIERRLKVGHWNNIPLRTFYAKIAHYNRYRMLELRSRLAEV
ncbi:MAG: hypothetical protein U9O85_00950 [Euryarchaeota archaeon]|nr:hypothetical protein [Euryarchaeota archaeon]